MNKWTKTILSIIGVAAIVVPALLLLVMSARTREAPNVPTEDRQINIKDIYDTTNKLVPTPAPFSSPNFASPSASKESTKSSGKSQ